MKRQSVLLAIGFLGAACSPASPALPEPQSPQPDLASMAPAPDLGPEPMPPPVPRLSVVAGLLGGSGNADDVGADARFSGPSGVASDGTGNLYATDPLNNSIRKIVLATRAVSTIAGAGTVGSLDGTGSAAQFRSPTSIVLDGSGSGYIADTENHTIRKLVLATGEVTTIAGTAGTAGGTDGVGSAARFNFPRGMAMDTAGNLYVADSSSHTIRKVSLPVGTVSTLAGTAGQTGAVDATGAAARFYNPRGVALDGAGNLYVVDTNNSAVRKVVLATGAVSTIAGGRQGRADGIGTAAQFFGPTAAMADRAGNLYVADTSNQTIRRIELSTGLVVTFCGTPLMPGSADGTCANARFAGVGGMTLDPAGNVYIADSAAIRKLDPSSAAVTTVAGAAANKGSSDGIGTAARFNYPRGMVMDGAGSLYVLDTLNQVVRKLVPSSGAVSTIAGSPGVRGTADGIGAAARFTNPVAAAMDRAGNIYLVEEGRHAIRKLVPGSGAVSTITGEGDVPGSNDGIGTAAHFFIPYGVAVDEQDNLYVADRLNSTIRKVILSTGAVSTIAGSVGQRGSADGIGVAARFSDPQGMVADRKGSLYIADSTNHTIRRLTLATGEVSTIAGAPSFKAYLDGIGSAARFASPWSLAMDSAGDLYVAENGNATIRKVRIPSFEVTTLAGVAAQRGIKPGSLPARLSSPSGLAVSPTGEIFVSDLGENVILSIR